MPKNKIIFAITSDDVVTMFKAVKKELQTKRKRRMGDASVVIELCKFYVKHNKENTNE